MPTKSGQDSEVLSPKSVEDIFSAPGSGIRLVRDNPEEEAPEEISNFLFDHGLSKNPFKCMLKKVPAGGEEENLGNSQGASYIVEWHRSVPSLAYIAKHYGPGEYVLHFTWRAKDQSEDGDGKSKLCMEDVPLSISELAEDEHRKFLLEEKLRWHQDVTRKARDNKISNNLERESLSGLIGEDGESKSPRQIAKEVISESLDMVKSLGIPIGMGMQPAAPKPDIPWIGIIGAAVPLLVAFMESRDKEAQRRTDESNKMMMLMLGMGEKNTTQLLELMKATSGQGTGNVMMKELFDMLKTGVDMKAILSPEKPSLADRIFEMVEGIAPAILQVLATVSSAKAAQDNMMVKMGKGFVEKSPDFQQMLHDPVELAKFVIRLDDFYGWEQADTMMEVMGWTRPEACVRDPAKQLPINMRTTPNEEVGETE